MSTSARKRSTRSSKDEDTFAVDGEEAPSLGNEKIGPHEEWSSVRETLYKVGWKWKKGPGLISYVYLKPHIDSIKDKRRHIDYFIDESHLKEYVAVKYKWKGEKMDITSKPVRSSTRVSVQRKKVTLTRNQDTSTPRDLSRRSRTSKATTMNTSARMKRKRILDKLDDDDSYKESCTSVESENNIENNNKKPKKANKKSPNKNNSNNNNEKNKNNKNNNNKNNNNNHNNNKNIKSNNNEKGKKEKNELNNTEKRMSGKYNKYGKNNNNNKTINNKNTNDGVQSDNESMTDDGNESSSSLERVQQSKNKIVGKSKNKKSGSKARYENATVVRGSKTKPGLISFAEDNDHRIGRKVAFLIDSKEGRSLTNYFDDCIPAEAIQTYIQKSDPVKFLVGVVNKRSKIAKRKNCYTVAWEWSCATLHEVDFEVTTIDRAISQYVNIYKNMRYSSLPGYSFEENYKSLSDKNREQWSKEMNNMYKFDVIESEDDYSDDDGFDLDNLHINHNVNDEKNYGKYYSTIRHSRNLDSDLTMSFSTERGGVSSTIEETNGLKWEMNGKLQAPSGLGIRPKTKIKGNISCFSTELESLLAFLPLRYWVHHLEECNKYVAEVLDKRERFYSESVSIESYNKRYGRKFQGMKWKPIRIDELMVFYAIIIQMACRPFPGKKFEECWNYTKDWFTNCEHMNKTRFKQIRAALHWSDNPHSHSKSDTLYKVRPIINVLEKTIGRYLEVGQEVALDETTIGLYHAYAKALTYYNPSKPRGKHHCKLFVLCENDYWSAINFHFAHRSYDKDKSTEQKKKGNDSNRKKKTSGTNKTTIAIENSRHIPDSDASSTNTVFNEDEVDESEAETKEVPKMVQLVTSMCKCLKGTGIVVNMDNLYSSPEVFIALKKIGIYARGTFRSNRKYLPSFVKFTKSETLKLPRGCFRLATNEEHNLSCYAWNDKNPVHILSSADGTDVETTRRRSKSEKINVLCPSAVKRYNQGMQAVDQFNKLLTLFSLASLKFDKYYKKIAMVLLDFAITNAYLHHKIANNTKDNRQYTRVKFMKNLQEQLIDVDWSEKIRRHQMDDSDDESLYSNDEMHFRKKDFNDNLTDEAIEKDWERRSVKKLCNPIAMQASICDFLTDEYALNIKLRALSDSQRVCQICEFEGRGRRRTGVNYCPHHKIRACTLKNPHPENLNKFRLGGVNFDIDLSESSNSWLCPDGSLTCWEKAHNWYIPNGLFHIKKDYRSEDEKNKKFDFMDISKINWSSKLAKQRKKQLKNSLSSIKEGSVRKRKSHLIDNPPEEKPLSIFEFYQPPSKRVQKKLGMILDKPVEVPRVDEIIDSQSHQNENLKISHQGKGGSLNENNNDDVSSEKTREYEIDGNSES